MAGDNQQKKSEKSTEPQENINELPERSIPERDAQAVKGGAARQASPMDPMINTAGRN
jgi:hypothetical protein